jgi:hypothetical protein
VTAIEETTMETTARDMLGGEHTPVFDALVEELGAPMTYRRKAEQEYNEERNRPKPRPPAGKTGVKRS